MQIVRTDVSRAKALTGEPVLRVLFCGEGGDCVTVDMASVESGNDGAALDRARAILMQTATFGLAANDYDARSNGISTKSSSRLPLMGTRASTYSSIVTAKAAGRCRRRGCRAAREEAIRCAIDLLVDLEPGTDALTGWLVRVRDESGELLCAIDVQEAEAARQLRQ